MSLKSRSQKFLISTLAQLEAMQGKIDCLANGCTVVYMQRLWRESSEDSLFCSVWFL